MRFILISVICLTASVAVAVDNLLPPVGTEWKTARNAAAQAAFSISELNGSPAFHVTISSDSGYAYYRSMPKVPPGEYTFQVRAAGTSRQGLSVEIYSFDSNNVPKALLFLKTPAGTVSSTILQKTFKVPENSAYLRIGVGLNGAGDAHFAAPKLVKGKLLEPERVKAKSLQHPAAEKWMAEWIWLKADPGLPRIGFTKEMIIEDTVTSAFLQLTADNAYVLSVNGKTVGSDAHWQDVEIYDITQYLHKGSNTFTVNVLNYDGLGGLILQGLIQESNGKLSSIVSDSSWRIFRPDEKKETELAVIGKVPVAPWGNLPFHKISYPSLLNLKATEIVNNIAPGEILKYVFPLPEELESMQPKQFKLQFRDSAGKKVPIAGLPPVVRLEKRIRKLFVELPVSKFAYPGQYNATIICDNFVIPCGNISIASGSSVQNAGRRLPKPSESNLLKTPEYTQSLFIYSTDTPCPEHFRSWSRTGGHLYELLLTTGQWKSSGGYDTAQCEQQLLEILENDPCASVLLKFRIDAPSWWIATHQDDVFRSNKERFGLQSYCSEQWRKDAIKTVGDTLETLAARPAGKAVSGVILMGFRGGEFQLWGEDVGEYDCSPVAQKAFLAYQKAKRLPGEIRLPHPALEYPFRTNSPEYAKIRDLFFRFTAERHAGNLIFFAKEFKKRFGERFTFGVYYGYGMEYSGNFRRLLFSGHLGIEKVLNEAPLDLLSAPFSYNLRGEKQSHAFMNPIDSARLHKILPIGENDIRNYRSPHFSDSSGKTVFSFYDSVITNRRIRLLGASHGALVRYLALHHEVDAYASPEMVRTIVEDNYLVSKLKPNCIGAPGQLALVLSYTSWTKSWRLPQKLVADFAGTIRDTVMRTGRDVVFITFSDYLNMGRKFQHVVIPLPGLLDSEQKTALEKLSAAKLPPISPEDGALVFCDGKWEVVTDKLKTVWEKLATAEAKKCGSDTVWYVGRNFCYTWDGKTLKSR